MNKSILNQIQLEHNEWRYRNFPNAKSYQTLLGLAEEVGELCHAFLKKDQSIRMNEDHDANIIDAIGDIAIFLMAFCNMNGINLENTIIETWEQVKKRDWTNETKTQ